MAGSSFERVSRIDPEMRYDILRSVIKINPAHEVDLVRIEVIQSNFNGELNDAFFTVN